METNNIQHNKLIDKQTYQARDLRQRYTQEIRGTDHQVKAYKELAAHLEIPYVLSLQINNQHIPSERHTPIETIVDFNHPKSPKGQKEFAHKLYEELRIHSRVYGKAVMASGKTTTGIWLSGELGKRTMVVVDSVGLAKQWKKEIETFSPSSTVQIESGSIPKKSSHSMRNRGAKPPLPTHYKTTKTDENTDEHYDFTIYTIETLVRRIEDNTLDRGRYDFIIMDEADTYGSERRMFALASLKADYYLAFSGTPKRKDNADELFFKVFDFKLVESNNKPLGVDFISAKIHLPEHEAAKLSKVSEMYLMGGLPIRLNPFSKLNYRNTVIQHIVRKCVESKRKMLLIAKYVETCEFHYNTLVSLGFSVISFAGDKAIDKKLAAQYDIIISTAQKVKRGIDMPWLDTCLELEPVSFHDQRVGRITRIHDDKQKPMYIMLKDVGVPDFEQVHDQRLEIIKRKSTYSENHRLIVREF